MSRPNNTPEQETPPEAEKKTPKYDKDFETFWAAYPRKADKGQCYKKYKARIKDGYSPEELSDSSHELCRTVQTAENRATVYQTRKDVPGRFGSFCRFSPENERTAG